MRKIKKKKVKPPLKEPGAFVLSTTNLIGVDIENNLIRLRDKLFAGAIKISGTDIDGLKEYERDIIYNQFGAAEQICTLKHKIIICDCKVDYNSQLSFLRSRLEKTDNPKYRFFLERQIEWIKFYEGSQMERLAFVLFYSRDPDEVIRAKDRYVKNMEGAVYAEDCSWNKLLTLLKTILQSTEG